MSELKYCIDQCIMNTMGKIEISGWAIAQSEYKIRIKLSENNYKNLTYEKVEREDVKEALKIQEINTGFKACISVKEIIGYKSVTLEMELNDKWIAIKEIQIYELAKAQPLIISNIDDVEINEGSMKVRGWAFGITGKSIDIDILDTQCKVTKVERMDVKLAHKNVVEDSKVGFLIEGVSGKNKQIEIVYTLGAYEETQVINIGEWQKKKQLQAFKEKLNWIIMINGESIRKTLLYIKVYGIKKTLDKISKKIDKDFQKEINYNEWLKNHLPNEEMLDNQRSKKFNYTPQISIVVPTYNTPKQFLIEMIDSVIAQTYPNWQLCIADGGSKAPDTIGILKMYQEKDARIKVEFLDDNYGISGNTNKCLQLATGEFVGLFDHDDLLTPNALYEVVEVLNQDSTVDFIYSDEDKTDETTEKFFEPHFKPDFSPDLLRSQNYICHFTVFRRALLNIVGEFRPECDGSQDHDMILRLTEQTNKIVHIPQILYHWRVHSQSTAAGISAKEYTITAGIRAVQDHIERVGCKGQVARGQFVGSYKIDYEIDSEEKVSIIIPNKDHKEDLQKCIESIIEKTTYTNYEIIIVENNSTTQAIEDYYRELERNHRVTIVRWDKEFNYSAINNYGVQFATGKYYILLNNDIEIITPNWIEEMLMYCQRKDVGIVGAKLYYPDETIQHAGVIVGFLGVAGHAHAGKFRMDPSYFGRAQAVQNLSAVTAACLMIRKEVYEEVEGLDEKFAVAFNDIDLCLKVREKDYLIVFNPYVEAYHYESKSRGVEDTEEKMQRFNGEIERFAGKWGLYREDPYYNKNLGLDKDDFRLT